MASESSRSHCAATEHCANIVFGCDSSASGSVLPADGISPGIGCWQLRPGGRHSQHCTEMSFAGYERAFVLLI